MTSIPEIAGAEIHRERRARFPNGIAALCGKGRILV
jgi:hypothetical protein